MAAKKRNGTEDTRYCHEAVCAAAVKPGKPVAALPPMPGFIRNGDKQDCGRNAAERRLKAHKERYAGLTFTVFGDGLYCCHPVCKAVPEAGMNFPLVCKDTSRLRIAGQAEYPVPQTYEKTEWNGRSRLACQYKRVDGTGNRAEGETTGVNYPHFEIYSKEKKEIPYKNSWITDIEIKAMGKT
jgi:hypothetical protein